MESNEHVSERTSPVCRVVDPDPDPHRSALIWVAGSRSEFSMRIPIQIRILNWRAKINKKRKNLHVLKCFMVPIKKGQNRRDRKSHTWTPLRRVRRLRIHLLISSKIHLNYFYYVFVGSTATVCLVQDNYMLHIGHVGDSRAILCRENTVQTPDTCYLLTCYLESRIQFAM